jgi:hypothetical protein
MKKVFIFVAILLATATTITIVSCKKDKENDKNNIISRDISVSQENMDEYLLTFKRNLQNATQNDETISLEKAEQDLSNLLNFDFGDANYSTNEIRCDTIHAVLSMTNNAVSLYQLNIAYQSLFEQIVETYKHIDLPEKSIYSINCSFNKNPSDNKVDIVTVMKTRSYIETTRNYLDWRAGNLAGTCENELVGICGAPEKIVGMLRANMLEFECLYGGRVYFTDEACAYKLSTDSDMGDPNAPRGRKLFYECDPNQSNLENTCLLNDEILYYYGQAGLLKQTNGSTFLPNPIPSNHVVTDYWIDCCKSIAGHVAWWKISIWHAKMNCTSTGPEL